jgi:GMP synthase (glutamine-hydrolysing)
MDARTAVILLHEQDKGPGLALPALEAAGYRCVQRWRTVQPGDADAALVLVMGGSMGVYDAPAYPHLSEVQALLAERLRRDLPSVGVCLGAQLLAAAAGARVYRGHAGMELGVYPVQLLPEAAGDPVFSVLPHRVDAAQWHGDTFDPVPGAVRLAHTEAYPWQAFRLGRSYGVQFHPELSVDTFCAWLDEYPDAVHAAGKFVEQVRQDEVPLLRRSQPTWGAFWARLFSAR